jgi:hypothetical protein
MVQVAWDYSNIYIVNEKHRAIVWDYSNNYIVKHASSMGLDVQVVWD